MDFTDDPIDLEDSLASEPGGNQMVKKKKKSAYLSWNELMENIILSLVESTTKDNDQIEFEYTEDDSTERDREKGWNVSRLDAFINGEHVGKLRISYIPLDKFNQIYKSVWHYLANMSGWNTLKKILKTDEWKDPKVLWQYIYPYLRYTAYIQPEEEIRIIKKIENDSSYNDDFSRFRRHWVNKPMIDSIQVSPEWKRKGIGTSLYKEGARIMAEKGLKLYASGIQSDEAKAVWRKMPVKTKSGRRFLKTDKH